MKFQIDLEFWDENVHPLDKEKAYEDILNNQNKTHKLMKIFID